MSQLFMCLEMTHISADFSNNASFNINIKGSLRSLYLRTMYYLVIIKHPILLPFLGVILGVDFSNV